MAWRDECAKRDGEFSGSCDGNTLSLRVSVRLEIPLTGEGLKMYPDMYFKKYMHRQKNAV